MIPKRQVVIACLAGALLLLLAAAANVTEGFAILVASPLTGAGQKRPPGLEAVRRIDRALETKTTQKEHTFEGTAADPFRPLGARAPVASKPRGQAPESAPLTLRGILVKDQALAILEDQSGRTSICRRGDTVLEFTVVAIEPDKVVLSNKGRRYTLHVAEE